LFWDNPGRPVPEELLDFYGAGEDNGGRGTDRPGTYPTETSLVRQLTTWDIRLYLREAHTCAQLLCHCEKTENKFNIKECLEEPQHICLNKDPASNGIGMASGYIWL